MADFEKWAKLYSGCDGGNLNGVIWLCGIEWGGGDDPDKLDFQRQIDVLNKRVPGRSPKDTKLIIQNSSKKYVYDHNAFKLLTTILTNRKLEESDYKEYAAKFITYTNDSQFFKMNLYPISFRDTSEDHWNEKWKVKTGLPTKYHYKLWCWKNRFPEIKKWVKKGNPKLMSHNGI